MCGICGFVGRGDAATLTAMNERLRHRGPDAAGTWYADGIGLAMQRLAIVDIATGDQPVWNEDASVGVVFNGEIYNHVELRERLRGQGHRFRTDHSDTEVIVHLYEDYGLDFVQHLNGMFAIALWDVAKKRLVLARDRLGIKPLYYANVRGGLIFGSEPKALLAHPAVTSAPDPVALHHYFSLKNIPSPMSAFADIQQLRGGEMAIYQDSVFTVSRYWQMRYAEDDRIDERAASEELRALLEDSVRLQMRSDVPVGAFLSGGIDSSSVVALMAKTGATKLKTFTLVYEENFVNKDADRRFAREIASRYGTEHHEHLVRPTDVCDRLDEIIAAFDEPFSGVISTFFLTEEIARHVKVALSGDGADELFGSYLSHRIAIPLSLARQGREKLQSLSGDERLWLGEFADRQDWLLSLAAMNSEAAARTAILPATDKSKLAFYAPDFAARVRRHTTVGLIDEVLRQCNSADPLNRMLFLDAETLLPDQVLSFVDRLSMAHSVEVRPPFLDHRLVEWTGKIPGRLKIRQGRGKHILKEAVKDLLPPDLIDRPKEGFLMPINAWILNNLQGYVRDTLSDAALAEHGYFDASRIRQLLDDHYARRLDAGNQIWNLLIFQRWWDKYQ